MENSKFSNEQQLTTTHESCNILIDLLLQYGVKHAVVSPGSRNAPIIIALSRCSEIKKYVIVDERSAAFVALGISQCTHEPVAIVCTSGSAVLNYAPAVAEAYYQQLPLIVISADRPNEWINQNDSQTIIQPNILNNIVKDSYNIPAKDYDKNSLWYINRTINEALDKAISSPLGPVHINIQFDEPLYECKPFKKTDIRQINTYKPVNLSQTQYEKLAHSIKSYKRVMVLASMHNPCRELTTALDNISAGNIVVLSEIIANNNHSNKILHNIDRLFTQISENEWKTYSPDLLITFGGAPVSRLVKSFLRKATCIEHWRIGIDNNIIDTMQNLTQKIEISPVNFFTEISKQPIKTDGDYFKQWKDLADTAKNSHNNYIEHSPWSDLKAMDIIMKSIPEKGVNLQISNGSAIRYADIMGVPQYFEGSCHCNRGVSGIDGSTSTALGASISTPNTTVLITGDMSFSYDLNGLTSQYNSKLFKIVVLCNGGGGIFRFINGPSMLPEFEQYFEVHRDIPIEKYAHAFGFDYIEADNEATLQDGLYNLLYNNSSTILAVYTNNKVSAKTLRGYFNRNKQ